MSFQAVQNSSVALTFASMFLIGAGACSGGDDDGGGGGGGGAADAGISADADISNPPLPDADVAVTCATVADFADLGVIDGDVIAEEGYLSIASTLDEGPPQDFFAIELFGGFEPFADGITTGTFEITGAQTDYNTCGVCPVVYGDISETGGMIYMAQSGTVTVSSIEGNFTGSFTPAAGTTSYVGFSVDESTGDFVRQDACVVTGGGASWDKAIPVMQ